MVMALRKPLLKRASAAATSTNFHNAVVAGTGGDYTTLAQAESALTAPFIVVVRQGTYAGTTLAKVGLDRKSVV